MRLGLRLGDLLHTLSPEITAFPDFPTWSGLANLPCNSLTLEEGFAEKLHDNLGGHTMDDTSCQDFFAHPTTTLHRRFEVLRAFFLDHRPLTEIAAQFGCRYGTLRNQVAQFRAQCRAGRIPPFSLPRLADVPQNQNLITLQRNPIPRPRPITTNSL
jgi:hypothetical protein